METFKKRDFEGGRRMGSIAWDWWIKGRGFELSLKSLEEVIKKKSKGKNKMEDWRLFGFIFTWVELEEEDKQKQISVFFFFHGCWFLGRGKIGELGEKKIGNFFETKVFERKIWEENFIENTFRRPQFRRRLWRYWRVKKFRGARQDF